MEERLEEIEKPELLDKIATEEDAVELAELVNYLQKVKHPALDMGLVM